MPDSPRVLDKELVAPLPTKDFGNRQKLAETEEDDRVLEPGKKVIVTEIALDDWLAQ